MMQMRDAIIKLKNPNKPVREFVSQHRKKTKVGSYRITSTTNQNNFATTYIQVKTTLQDVGISYNQETPSCNKVQTPGYPQHQEGQTRL